jgi:hypothetical protein
MEGQEEDEVQIIPLKADAVMCELTGCERPAQFLLKYKSGVLRADVKTREREGYFADLKITH